MNKVFIHSIFLFMEAWIFSKWLYFETFARNFILCYGTQKIEYIFIKKAIAFHVPKYHADLIESTLEQKRQLSIHSIFRALLNQNNTFFPFKNNFQINGYGSNNVRTFKRIYRNIDEFWFAHWLIYNFIFY